jgi:hypothetical protein
MATWPVAALFVAKPLPSVPGVLCAVVTAMVWAHKCYRVRAKCAARLHGFVREKQHPVKGILLAHAGQLCVKTTVRECRLPVGRT